MSKRNRAGRYMISWCKSAAAMIENVEGEARQDELPITIHLGAELANTRDAIAKLEEAIGDWMKEKAN